MFRSTSLRFHRAASALKKAYTTEQNPAKSLAEEALAQKAGRKITMPKGEKKPSKAGKESGNGMKEAALVGGLLTGSALGGLFYFGRPFEGEQEQKYVEVNGLSAAYKRCVERYHEFQHSMNEPMWDKLLPEPLPEPYRRPYTLVINLDTTLVYSKWDEKRGWTHAKRPGVDYFLSYLSQFYEIVIFTSQPCANARPILDKLDPYQYAMYRLYREGTRYQDGKYIKDLSYLNRDLSKVIMMDSNPESFCLQPENGIALKPWTGELKENSILEFIPFLEAIALTNPSDVRPVLKSFEGKHIPLEWHKREEEMNRLHRLQWEEEQSKKKTKRNLGSLLSGGGAQAEMEGPPPTYLEQMRKHVRETFATEFKVQEEAMKQEMEKQTEMMKEMKTSVWDLLTQTAAGQPLVPPGSEQPPQQQ
ncbi:HAD-like domain-containing protein [Sporodiniella umbellata]|nr:HAD-like domain-containing protein [Sporodiniella umbellata]